MRYAINLFPSHQPKITERLGYFAVHYVRYALVIVLFIVLIVFFLRVRVDQQLVDLKEKIAMQRTIISATQPLRSDLESTQRRISLIQSIFKKQTMLMDKLQYIRDLLPKAVVTKSIRIYAEGITIDGIANDYRVIQQFLSKLTESERFEKVSLQKVNRESVNAYEFSIDMTGYRNTQNASEQE